MLTNERISTLSTNNLPAGGDDPTRFYPTEAWYPVHYVQDLDTTKPTKFTLLGQDLVIWWDPQAICWRAFADQCPHRLVPLSEGRIAADGLLECPYHGWAFKGDGQCDRIPQQADGDRANESKRACATVFATAVQQGLLFIYPGNPENAPQVSVPLIEPLEEEPDKWICLNTFRDLPYDALTLLENVLDSSHVPFTHHRSVGNRANASTVELELLAAGKQGFDGFWQAGPRKGTLGSQRTKFIAPNLMWHDLTSKQFGRTMTVVYATPTRKGECRVFARFPFQFASPLPGFFIKLTPRWYSHMRNNAILEDDQIFLHYQERYLEAKGGGANLAKACYLPTRADTFVAALRTWVTDYEADPFPGQQLPPPLSNGVLLDRYHSHTQHCASCRGALATIQRVRLILAIAGAILWAGLPLLSLWGEMPSLPIASLITGIPLIAGGIWLWLGNLEREFYQGRAVPPRNLPENPKKKPD
jgi:phenylpropionate dioxygenase-like ring-hydroxylating dioxygenase large terminal subunit